MNINKLQFFEYALSCFTEDKDYQYQLIVEYGDKLVAANFLPEIDTLKILQKYRKNFSRKFDLFDFDSDGVGIVDIRKLVWKTFSGRFNQNLEVPDTVDLINAITSIVNKVDDKSDIINEFNIATNVEFIESGKKFDFYRFPNNSEFNVVSLRKLES
ncbi:unnamed protein product [Fructobacillus evanidus]|uniref:Uncharacterized protein n=1 Tax=Fructobacillus evanidus TaxID=3064281 RepID=A0ABM9N1U8_9LACO|nr:unnamed protein product [Fructobacillus sp. LMG 32999]CAK1243622.1 unnamed protein product [Fructobacillus sp. LMG 32999]CAK1254184.1 unnamed protein product [Fructobacillus sp. LMG 32999]CAK1254680.1 unnamed protein product [Fructobacillus sp. LMG 32999]